MSRRPSLRVLESFQEPQPTTNPYIVMLLAALRVRCDVRCFTWKRALTWRFDVFHVHWPEVLIRGGGGRRSAARRVLFALLLLRLAILRVPIVRTLHNTAPHEAPGRIDAWLLRRLDRQTRCWIRLNPLTRPPGRGPVVTILHGHYRDWFTYDGSIAPEPGRAVYFGFIRPYKGVDRLITAFAGVQDARARLVILGSPNSAELAQQLRGLASADPRVELRLEHADDATLAEEVRRASIVVLPYREMHNSGALLLSLSLDRPALVPAGEVPDALAAEVGSGWIRTYTGSLDAGIIEAALQLPVPQARPDLTQRDWARAADQHVDAFRVAI